VNFEILRSNDGGFFARIKAANHEIVFWSETYTSKQSAINACQLVQGGAGGATIYDQT
jgi:uncharacterized protein YegP (UPF0339 family)